jgi:tetratricopeptide (TPR) repeat protein
VRTSEIALLEKSELTVDEYSLKFWALAWSGLSQGQDLNDWQTAKSTLERGLKVAETATARFSDQKQPQTDLPTAHSYLARALERNGDYYGALRHYEVALELNRKASIQFNLFWHDSQMRLLLRVADMLHKTGNSERSLEKLREALALRHEVTAVNHADPRIKHSHAIALIEIGRVFAITGRADEAQAVYRNAEEMFQQLLPAESHGTFTRVGLARVNMHIGDIYANCLPDEVDLKQVNRSQLLEAVRRYQESVKIYAEISTGLTEPSKVDQRLAQAKLAASLEKLKAARS